MRLNSALDWGELLTSFAPSPTPHPLSKYLPVRLSRTLAEPWIRFGRYERRNRLPVLGIEPRFMLRRIRCLALYH